MHRRHPLWHQLFPSKKQHNNRRFQRKVMGIWIPVSFEKISKGMRVRIFEPDGKLMLIEGKTEFLVIATTEANFFLVAHD